MPLTLHKEIIFIIIIIIIIIIINNKKLQETTVFSGRQKLTSIKLRPEMLW